MNFRLTTNRLVLLLSVYALMVLNVGVWRVVWQGGRLSSGTPDWVLLLTMPLFLLAVINLLLQLLFWPKVHRLLMPLLLLVGAGVAYGVMVQGIFFNAEMLQNVLQTDRNEASSWLSVKFGLWFALTGVLPAVCYVRYGKPVSSGRWYRDLAWRAGSVAASLAVVAVLAATAYQHYAFFLRNHSKLQYKVVPLNVVVAAAKTARNAYEANRPFENIATDAVRTRPDGARKRVLLLVVGETTRAQNWGLNPGAPDTTPQLKQIEGVINYPQVSSCGTATAVSVPCMFSDMARADYDGNRARHRENVLDVLQRAGVQVLWRENDGGCKGVCDRVEHVDARALAEAADCTDEGCYDMALLNGLQQKIAALPGDGVIVLHTIGSHGPTYFRRYPQALRRFAPTCDTGQLQDCAPEALANTYNNTIVYIDHVLASAIRLLSADIGADAALWYVSDHGESLGEGGMYLHGAPYAVAPAEQTHVPMVFWAAPAWYHSSGISSACLQQHAGQAYSHDDLFHSLLGVFEVKTAAYQPELDLFAACRSAG